MSRVRLFIVVVVVVLAGWVALNVARPAGPDQSGTGFGSPVPSMGA